MADLDFLNISFGGRVSEFGLGLVNCCTIFYNNSLPGDFRANFTVNISDVLTNENVTMSNVSYKEYFLLK